LGFETVDEYVATLPAPARESMMRLRELAHQVMPDGVEAISYQIPTIRRHGHNVVHFAAWARHFSVYPIPEGDPVFAAAIAPYMAGKGTLRFTYTEPLPVALITELMTRLSARADVLWGKP
jgi:uncharacterized protein YdhG (YjbR/CyaY superfamily)